MLSGTGMVLLSKISPHNAIRHNGNVDGGVKIPFGLMLLECFERR
jgi:hypothetical protein